MRYGELFAGAGGFSIGFEASGMSCEFQVEIDKTASAVLARHWPNVPRREDVRECGKRNLPRVDVLTFGFPCQDLSIAGQRKGLQGGTRSGLFYEAVRIGVELRCQFLVWENVPGLLSSDDGRDFARVLRHLADCDFHGGCRVLDAQHFGLAQRRKRVFGVFARGRFGAERCAEVLALREGVSGHSSACREEGEGTSRRLANCLRASGVGTERAGDTRGQDNVVAWPASKACTLNAHFGEKMGLEDQHAQGGASLFVPVNRVTHTLTANGFDASEDGTGRGTPLVAFSSKDHGADAGELCPTLRAMGHTTSHANGGGQVAIAYAMRTAQTGANGHGITENVTHTLDGRPTAVAYAIQERAVSENLENGPGGKGYQPDIAYTLEARHHVQASASALGVRRLTPRECERLQGWPDDHTRYRADGSEIADGPRYRLIGNGVAAPCAEWIGRRLMAT